MADDRDARLDALLEVMLAIARQDFSVRAPVGDGSDVVDGIAVGLNMLSEELAEEVISRRELERAHDALKTAQGQLAHASKLAAIGQLSAGLAHQINNPVQGIQLCLSIVERTHDAILAELERGQFTPDALRASLTGLRVSVADAQTALDRVRSVTSALRTFARADDEAYGPVDLALVVDEAARLFEASMKVRARFERALGAVPPIHGSRGKLGQLVANLLVNAIQAVPEGDPARHVIRATLRHEAEVIVLAVEDSGPGVPPADRDKVFEPFFTTKRAGLGVGLGLSLVAEIVRGHGGSVWVDDSPLGGARFEVRLPIHADRTVAAPTTTTPPPSAQRLRVLVVDDEPMLLRLYRLALEPHCDVVTKASGPDAIETIAAGERFDVIVCDLGLPGMDGSMVYAKALAIAPELKSRFVFASGGATTHPSRGFLESTTERTLIKPFDVETLLATIRAEPGR